MGEFPETVGENPHLLPEWPPEAAALIQAKQGDDMSTESLYDAIDMLVGIENPGPEAIQQVADRFGLPAEGLERKYRAYVDYFWPSTDN
jgi:hypothetical protein